MRVSRCRAGREAATVVHMDPATTTVVKITSPADVLGVLPYRLGFHPSESIVVICLQGPRRRDTLVMRLDLAPAEYDDAFARDVVERAARAEASAVILVCYTGTDAEPGDLPRRALVDQLVHTLGDRGIDVADALLVRSGRWWSYCCDDSECCPASGSPLPPELTPAAAAYAAEAVLRGDVVLPGRADLGRSVRPSLHPVAVAVRRQAAETAAQTLVDAVDRGGVTALRLLVLETLRRLVAAWCEGSCDLVPEAAATILIGLRDKQARDEAIILLVGEEPETLLALLVALAQAAEDADAAPICTVLAWVAYTHGDGALANVAIERALDAEPAYELARLIEGGLDAMVPPAEVRHVTEQVRHDLRAVARDQPK